MGHAYYANYLYWFEQARGAWCRARGFTYKQLEERGFFMPIVEAHVRYRGEVRYDDIIFVDIHLAEMRRSAIRFEYVIRNETSGATTTEGYTWQVVMGTERKALSIPDGLRELLNREPACAATE